MGTLSREGREDSGESLGRCYWAGEGGGSEGEGPVWASRTSFVFTKACRGLAGRLRRGIYAIVVQFCTISAWWCGLGGGDGGSSGRGHGSTCAEEVVVCPLHAAGSLGDARTN